MRRLLLIATLLITCAGPAWAWNDDARLCYEQEGDLEEVIAACTRAVNSRDLTNAGRGVTLRKRGNAYNKKSEYDRAIADYNQALRLKPDYAEAFYNRGVAYERKGDLVQAERDYRMALSLDPGQTLARGNLDKLTQRLATAERAPRPQPAQVPAESAEPASGPQPSRALVERAQRHLNDLGFDAGPADGVSGRRTRAAVAAFQEVVGMAGDGEVTEDLVARLDQAVKIAAMEPRDPAPPAAAAAPTEAPQAVAAAPAPAVTAPAPAPEPVIATAPTRRVALVIGNGAYTNAPALDNPANDARAIAASLRRLGFEVTEGVDLSRSQMEDTLLEFAREAEAADQALVFYAGHGIQVDGRNYLLPVDVTLEDERDLRRYPTADQVVVDAAGARRFALVILDACRDNPFTRSLARRMGKRAFTVGRGLAAPGVTPPNTLIAYATGADAVAADAIGEQSGNSPFTTALLRYLEQPGLEVGLLFRKVRDAVYEATGGQQVPFTYGSLGGDEIYLASTRG